MTGCTLRMARLAAVVLPDVKASFDATGADAVAVNVTGASAATVAVTVLAPAADPSVQLPTVATPFDPVVAVAPVNVPPPDVTAKVTLTPDTALPADVFTTTLGNV